MCVCVFVWLPLTLAVEGVASRSVSFLGQVSHSPAGPITTTQQEGRLKIYLPWLEYSGCFSLIAWLQVSDLLQIGIRQIQVSSCSWLYYDSAWLHGIFVIHKPQSVGSKANQVPLACHLNEKQEADEIPLTELLTAPQKSCKIHT